MKFIKMKTNNCRKELVFYSMEKLGIKLAKIYFLFQRKYTFIISSVFERNELTMVIDKLIFTKE